jgi:hypothetical protein
MEKFVILDWRNICKIQSYSILSGAIACHFPTEPEEIAHRIAKRMYCIRFDYPEATLIIANDHGPYWRKEYVNAWYNDRGLEPIGYKANRASISWPFASAREDIDALYNQVLEQLLMPLSATRIEDQGMEADDVWGLLIKHYQDIPDLEFVGISSDSDWRQLCGPRVTVVDPSTNITHKEPADIRPKCIAGDRGDFIMGCNKKRKDGTPGTTMWGIDGAKKLLLTDENWESKVDMEIFERNYNLICLPCPLWNVADAFKALEPAVQKPADYRGTEAETIWDSYGLTAPVRKMLEKRAERDAWITKLRSHLQIMNKAKEVLPPSGRTLDERIAQVELGKETSCSAGLSPEYSTDMPKTASQLADEILES